MIIKALSDYHDILVRDGKVMREGWCHAKVAFAVCLDRQGNITGIRSLRSVPEGQKSQKERDRVVSVPEQPPRTSGISPAFLCDNSKYFLGYGAQKTNGKDKKQKQEKNESITFEFTPEHFAESSRIHHKLLDACKDSETAAAILAFFDTWKPEEFETHPVVSRYKDLLTQGMLLFIGPDGRFAQDDPVIADAWNHFYEMQDGATGMCMVTGKTERIATVHPSIKGIYGAQSSGAKLVSFNKDTFESYGRIQGMNAPISQSVASKYAAALNYMVMNKSSHEFIGDEDMVLLFWTENAESAYGDIYKSFMFGDGDEVTPDKLKEIAGKLRKGEPVASGSAVLKSNEPFYVLGISPNAARLSVRYFRQGSFGEMLDNLVRHYEDLAIIGCDTNHAGFGTNAILMETIRKEGTNKAFSKPLITSLLFAILNGTPYPAELLTKVLIRIRAEKRVTWRKAAIIKACLLRQTSEKETQKREVLTLELNKESTYTPYVLGRLFAVLELIQKRANPSINATIRDRYIASASTTPAVVFPVLLRLAQSHLKKMPSGDVWCDRQISDLTSRITGSFPARLSLQDQGIFYLGYYHEKEALYTKKEDK